ncbi:Hypothetical predicted protein, partial [Marmota monax]
AIPGGLSIGPPGKSSIDDSYGRYDLIQNSESPASPPVAVPHSWSRAKSDSDKISNGSSINWPPEFHPGVPWKGLQNIDPENDPDVTPGSVPTGPTINTTIQDVNRYLLKSGGEEGPSTCLQLGRSSLLQDASRQCKLGGKSAETQLLGYFCHLSAAAQED